MPTTEIEKIIDASLPEITISRVTLENSGGDFAPRTNPHVDVPSEIAVQKNNNQEAMKVSVRLTVADATTQNSLNYLIGNQDLVDLLDVHVAYTTSKEQTDFIVNRNPTLDQKLMRKSPSSIGLSVSPLSAILNPNSFNLYDPQTTKKYTITDDDGSRITYYSLDYVPTGFDNTMPYLSFFACCRINLDRLFAQAQGTIDIQQDVVDKLPPDLLAGSLSTNLVLRDGNVISTMQAFIDVETSQIWTGPTHTMSDGRVMTGENHTNESRYVVGREIPNTRIQDFRIRSYIDKRGISIGESLETINDQISRTASSQKVTFDIGESYFSNISLSRDKLGQARFLFSFDYDRIIEDYTLFGGLLKKRSIVDPKEIYERFCTISSLKIFRRRIGGSSETGSKPLLVATTINADTFVPLDPAVPASNIDCNQVDELIVFTSELPEKGILEDNQYIKPGTAPVTSIMNSVGPSIGAIPPVSTTSVPPSPLSATSATRAGNRGQVVGTIEEVSGVFSSRSGIRYVSGIDKSMPQVTDGYYQYRIEMEVIDKTSDYVLENIEVLQSGKDTLQMYYNDINTSLNSFTWKEEPHIDYESEGQTISRNTQATYDKSKITSAIDSYLRTLLLFTNETTASEYDPSRPASVDALRGEIMSLLNPTTPNGTLMVIELMDTLIRGATDSLSIKDLNVSARLSEAAELKALQPSNFMNQSQPDLSFSIGNKFSNYFNSNTPKETYYDFMDFDVTNQDLGLKVARESFFINRIERENKILFNESDPNLIFEINGNEFNTGDSFQFTDFGYLSPAIVRLNNATTIPLVSPSSAPSYGPTPSVDPINAVWATSFMSVGPFKLAPLSEPNAPITAYNESTNQGSTSVNLERALRNKLEALGVIDNTPGRNQEALPSSDATLTDPVNKDNQICDTVVPSDGANPFPVFNRLLEEINPNSYQFGGPYETTGQANFNEVVARLNQTIRSANTFYTPDNPTSPANRYLKESPHWTPDFLYRGEPHLPGSVGANVLSPSQIWIMTTPNHMKALTKDSVLPVNIRNTVAKAQNSIESQSEVKLRFFIIDVIEVLVGYDQNQLQKPLWQPLNRSIWNRSIGEKMVCRLVPYQNSIFGISRDIEHEMPTVDNYFIVEPTTNQTLPTQPAGSNILPFEEQINTTTQRDGGQF
tara:strand:- start:1195 stop:4680 length:3486 start_codon:yes stop_codon:yes gene_type:complete